MRISVIGAGLMGHGIALSFAKKGIKVNIYDANANVLKELPKRFSESLEDIGVSKKEIAKVLKSINQFNNIENCVSYADLVIEAVPEKLTLKQRIFQEIEEHVSKDCILASNTSVMPITSIMKKLKHRQRALGTHWWNPPHLIPLVEVISTKWTDKNYIDKTMSVLKKIGKKAVRVNKDVPGFIGNRLQHAMWREAIYLVEKGICDAQSVDEVVKASFGRRLSVLGPIENIDLVGTDLTVDIHNQVLADLDARHKPSPYIKQLVKSKKLGMKTNEGFYKWNNAKVKKLKSKLATHLKNQQDT